MSLAITAVSRAIGRRELPLALAVEIEGQLHHAWAEANDADRYWLLIWTRPAALRPLVDAIIRASELQTDEFETLSAWFDADRSMIDYMGRMLSRGLSTGAFQRAEVGIRALAFLLKPWSSDVAIERFREAGVRSTVLRKILKAGGPPTLEEILAAVARPR